MIPSKISYRLIHTVLAYKIEYAYPHRPDRLWRNLEQRYLTCLSYPMKSRS